MSSPPLSLAEIRRALAEHAPRLVTDEGRRRAAVAMLLRERRGASEVLLIERARRAGDPWSGHMAFPGGRVDATDPSTRVAAERETLEEVGVSLAAAEPIGRLDDLQGHEASGHPTLVISGFVYHLPEPAPLVINHEVEAAFWFPLGGLLETERHVERRFGPGNEYRYPGLLVGEPERHVVWGLTYRFLEIFFSAVGRPLPERAYRLPPGASREEREASRG